MGERISKGVKMEKRFKVGFKESGGMEMERVVGRIWKLLYHWGSVPLYPDYKHIVGNYYWESRVK